MSSWWARSSINTHVSTPSPDYDNEYFVFCDRLFFGWHARASRRGMPALTFSCVCFRTVSAPHFSSSYHMLLSSDKTSHPLPWRVALSAIIAVNTL